MKCSFCGNEIKLGSVYCEKCGKATQIVPDYNVLEDDLLPQILEERKKAEQDAKKKSEKGGRLVTAKKLWKNKKTRWACILSTLVALILVIGIVLGVQNSYTYQYQQGVRQDKRENYKKALEHYLRAIELDDTKLAAKIGAGFDYYELKQYEDAKRLLWDEAMEHSSDKELFRCLILSCIGLKDYGAIEELQKIARGQETLALFDEYLSDEPLFSVEEGEYEDDVELTLSAADGYEIYYTLDGTDPVKKGRRYQEALILTDGKTVVKAVCKNGKGVFGQIAEKTYEIHYDIPDYPRVSPMQGTFGEPTYLTIEAEEGSAVYYTWDGSDPTAASSKYTEPILVPEGNNVLSVLVIDKHGISSDILRCNYKYLP